MLTIVADSKDNEKSRFRGFKSKLTMLLEEYSSERGFPMRYFILFNEHQDHQKGGQIARVAIMGPGALGAHRQIYIMHYLFF